jgi:hypothetical protein
MATEQPWQKYIRSAYARDRSWKPQLEGTPRQAVDYAHYLLMNSKDPRTEQPPPDDWSNLNQIGLKKTAAVDTDIGAATDNPYSITLGNNYKYNGAYAQEADALELPKTPEYPRTIGAASKVGRINATDTPQAQNEAPASSDFGKMGQADWISMGVELTQGIADQVASESQSRARRKESERAEKKAYELYGKEQRYKAQQDAQEQANWNRTANMRGIEMMLDMQGAAKKNFGGKIMPFRQALYTSLRSNRGGQ